MVWNTIIDKMFGYRNNITMSQKTVSCSSQVLYINIYWNIISIDNYHGLCNLKIEAEEQPHF